MRTNETASGRPYGSERLRKDRRTSPALAAGFNDESGIALFVVLWVLTLLTIIVGQLSFSVRHEMKALRNYKESTEAYYLAEAGLNLALLELIRGESRDRPDIEEDPDPSAEEASAWRVNAPIPTVEYAGGRIGIWIENSAGKINLNTADTPLLRLMLSGLELDEDRVDTIVDSIMDWRDDDEFHRLNGAESDYYQSLPDPYRSKNAEFDSVEELMLVKGVTPELFHGGLRDRATVFQDPAMPGRRLRSLFRKGSDIGANRINLNAASASVLKALPDMTDEDVEAIASFRELQDFKSLTEISDVIGADRFSSIAPYISLEMSPFYTIISEGMVHDSHVRQTIELKVQIDPMAQNRFRVLQRIES
ncbi:MAG: general secretion pathway protein GspK [Desulfobacterales bacterium]